MQGGKVTRFLNSQLMYLLACHFNALR